MWLCVPDTDLGLCEKLPPTTPRPRQPQVREEQNQGTCGWRSRVDARRLSSLLCQLELGVFRGRVSDAPAKTHARTPTQPRYHTAQEGLGGLQPRWATWRKLQVPLAACCPASPGPAPTGSHSKLPVEGGSFCYSAFQKERDLGDGWGCSGPHMAGSDRALGPPPAASTGRHVSRQRNWNWTGWDLDRQHS